MDVLLGQIVCTSFPGIGFRTLASRHVPPDIQQAFTQRVVSQYWDSYNPPRSGYRAVYLHQVTPERSLFGWLYNDGADDMRRIHVPYFICYYLAAPLYAFQLENIFSCLHNGPVALIDRHSLPVTLETMVLPDLWSYQGARPGVPIPTGVLQRSQIAQPGELLDLFVPVDEEEMVTKLNGQTYEQEKAFPSIYTRYIIEGIETSAASLNIEQIETRIVPQTTAVRNQKLVARKIKTKHLTPVQTLNEALVANEADISRGVLPQILSNGQINIGLEKSAQQNLVLAYRISQLLLKIGIAATGMALSVSIYGLCQTSIFVPRHHEVIFSPSIRVYLFHKQIVSLSPD